MEIWNSPYYLHSRFCLKPFGVWPFQEHHNKVVLRIITVLCVLTVLIPYIIKAYELRHQLHYLMLCTTSLLYYAHYLTKFIHLIFHADEARNLLDTVSQDFLRFKGESLRVLHAYLEMARRFNNFYMFFLCSSVVIFNVSVFLPHTLDLILPLANGSRPRAPARLVRYHIPKFDESFNFVLFHGFALDFIVIFIIIGFDALIFACAQHACALFKIVVVELRSAIETPHKLQINYDEFSLQRRQEVVYRGIANSIVLHKHALDFADRLNSLCALVNVLVVAISVATATFTEFETTANMQNLDIMVKFLFYTFAEFLNILYYNYPGQLVKDHSMLVRDSCCELDWHHEHISNRGRMLLVLMMLRSQTPSCLTAGNLFVLDLQNFLKVFKASVSYFAFLTSIHKA